MIIAGFFKTASQCIEQTAGDFAVGSNIGIEDVAEPHGAAWDMMSGCDTDQVRAVVYRGGRCAVEMLLTHDAASVAKLIVPGSPRTKRLEDCFSVNLSRLPYHGRFLYRLRDVRRRAVTHSRLVRRRDASDARVEAVRIAPVIR